MTCEFSNLGIQCVKKKDIEESLRVRAEIRVDPFRSELCLRSSIGRPSLKRWKGKYLACPQLGRWPLLVEMRQKAWKAFRDIPKPGFGYASNLQHAM
jgi:hypothetical protein